MSEEYHDLMPARRVATLLGEAVAERTILDWISRGRYPEGAYSIREVNRRADAPPVKRCLVSLEVTRAIVLERDARKVTPIDELRYRYGELHSTVSELKTKVEDEQRENARLAALVEELTRRVNAFEPSSGGRSHRYAPPSSSLENETGDLDEGDARRPLRETSTTTIPDGWFPWHIFCAMHDIPTPTFRSWAQRAQVTHAIQIRTKEQEAEVRNDPHFNGWLYKGHVYGQLVDARGLAYFWDKCRNNGEFVSCGQCYWCQKNQLPLGWYEPAHKQKNVKGGKPEIVADGVTLRASVKTMLTRATESLAPPLVENG